MSMLTAYPSTWDSSSKEGLQIGRMRQSIQNAFPGRDQRPTGIANLQRLTQVESTQQGPNQSAAKSVSRPGGVNLMNVIGGSTPGLTFLIKGDAALITQRYYQHDTTPAQLPGQGWQLRDPFLTRQIGER